VSGEAAYLPYVTFSRVDHHFFRNTGVLAEIFPESANSGRGVQLEGVASYYFTPQFSVGVGGPQSWQVGPPGHDKKLIQHRSWATARPSP
jgi:hypothetical protein